MTSVLMPLHISSLLLDREEATHLLSFATNQVSNTLDADLNILNLQVHSEGVFSRGILPSLTGSSNSCRHTMLALAVLIGHYERFIYSIHREITCEMNTNSHSGNTHHEDKLLDHEQQQFSTYHISDWMLISTPNKIHPGSHLIITIYPPNPHSRYSRSPSSSPTSTFPLRLIHFENSQIRLQSISAYLSTLGGGYFLCHHLSTALLLAKRQCKVALLRGDEDMAWRCRINMAYCWIYAGKLNKGRKVAKCVLDELLERLNDNNNNDGVSYLHTNTGARSNVSALQMNDYQKKQMCNLTIIKNMCLSALWFADKVTEAKLKEDNGSSRTHDDYKRVRVVKDRSLLT